MPTCTLILFSSLLSSKEPLLGVIREQRERPLRPNGARSIALNKEGSREQGKCNLEAGSTKFWKQEQGAAKKLGNGARRKRNYQGAKGKIKKEQGAKRDENGAVKIGKKEQA